MAIPNFVCVCVVLFSVSAVLWLFFAACISISIRLPLYVQGRGMGGGRVVRMALVNLPALCSPRPSAYTAASLRSLSGIIFRP